MKYNIISINDSRASYKETIRKRVNLDEVHIPATNALEVDLPAELEKRGLKVQVPWMSVGELGIWLSTFDCWQWAVDNNEELVVFEDDAIPTEAFNNMLWRWKAELPKDYDMLVLWVPDNQFPDYCYDAVFNEDGVRTNVGPNLNPYMSNYNFGAIRIARAYQGYGNVAMLYSPSGAAKLIEHSQARGIYEPIDVCIFCRVHTGVIDAYAPKPIWARAVTYDWAAETTVHHTERYT